MTNTKSIMIVGVGGQGSLLASKTLGRLLMNAGYDVKVSEVHGMSQRGGSVVTYVRYGQRVCSPVIQTGEADVLLSFELCEAARWSGYLKKDGVLITSTQQIMPMPVITGAAQYPRNGKSGCYGGWAIFWAAMYIWWMLWMIWIRIRSGEATIPFCGGEIRRRSFAPERKVHCI